MTTKIQTPEQIAEEILKNSGFQYCDTFREAIAAAIQAERNRYDETHALQLAAISTATIQNTESSIKERIGRDNPYWTPSYGDICVAIDREIKHRTRVEKLETALRVLYEETADYIQINNLGDIHHNQPMQAARAILTETL